MTKPPFIGKTSTNPGFAGTVAKKPDIQISFLSLFARPLLIFLYFVFSVTVLTGVFIYIAKNHDITFSRFDFHLIWYTSTGLVLVFAAILIRLFIKIPDSPGANYPVQTTLARYCSEPQYSYSKEIRTGPGPLPEGRPMPGIKRTVEEKIMNLNDLAGIDIVASTGPGDNGKVVMRSKDGRNDIELPVPNGMTPEQFADDFRSKMGLK